MRRLIGGLAVASFATGAFGAPLLPHITGHDINFGAFNFMEPAPEWAMNGFAPDTLTYTRHDFDTEATAYWPLWPTPPVFPLFNAGGAFGCDFAMQVMFTGQDAPYVGPGGVIDVSLTGTGANPGGPDLEIWGSIGLPTGPTPFGLLWALELEQVSLYGYAGSTQTYVLEGLGTIVGGLIAQENNLIGTPGGMRGHLDFFGAPPGWIPPLYHPLRDDRQNVYRAAYSGETGAVPEPASLAALAIGGFGLLARRRRR